FNNAFGQTAPVNGGLPGVFAVGELDADKVKYEKVSQLADSAVELADAVDAEYWTAPGKDGKELEDLERVAEPKTQFVRVDGHRGVVGTYSVTFGSDAVSDESA